MATKQEMLAEAYRRGLLPPEKKELYEEAIKRGLTGEVKQQELSPIMPGENTSTITGQPVQPGEMLRQNTGIQRGAEMVGNIPGSAVQLGKDLGTAIIHPVETVKNVGALAAGGVQKLIPGDQAQEPAADAFAQMVVDRYGSLDKFKETVVQDPVGALADISSLFMGGGAAIKGGGAVAKSRRLADAGKIVQRVGVAAEPLNIAKQGIVKPLSRAIPEGAPRGMYESAAKFSTVIPESQRKNMAQTALDAGIMPTSKGVDKARRMINTLNDEISAKIDAATQAGQKINADSVFKYLDEIKKETYLSDDPVRNLRAIESVEKSMRQGLARAGEGTLTPQQAQYLKQRIYQAVNFENRPRAPKYVEVAKKSVARAAKEELEALYPELKNLNAKEGALIQLLESIQRSANRINNRDLVGIGVPIKGTVGGVAAGPTGAAAGIVGGIIDTPQVKARLAIALEKARKAELANKPGVTAARAVLYQSGGLEE